MWIRNRIRVIVMLGKSRFVISYLLLAEYDLTRIGASILSWKAWILSGMREFPPCEAGKGWDMYLIIEALPLFITLAGWWWRRR